MFASFMKKFLIYSSGLTAIVLVFGILSVFGFFDLSDGKAQLIGPSKVMNTEVDIHNKIVDNVHEIGNMARDLNEKFKTFDLSSDINSLKTDVEKISQNKKSLEDTMKKSSIFNEEYLPAVAAYENSYKKLFAYTGAKPLDEAVLNSFKNSAQKAFEQYVNAHNSFVDELNRVRRY